MSIEPSEILLCEDNKRDADLTIRALRKHNISNNIVWVKDGEEAIEYLFAKGNYSKRSMNNMLKVVFLDLKMPKIDGMEVLEKIRSNSITRRIPVVIMTSSQEEADIARSYDLGANSYIVKPVDFNKFMDSIAEVGLYWLLLNRPPQTYQEESI